MWAVSERAHAAPSRSAGITCGRLRHVTGVRSRTLQIANLKGRPALRLLRPAPVNYAQQLWSKQRPCGPSVGFSKSGNRAREHVFVAFALPLGYRQEDLKLRSAE